MLRVIFILFFSLVLVLGDNFYDILGVPRSATQQQIRKAYKLKAREWHPDKSGDPQASDKFTKISEAYEVLSDPKKRREYDIFGQVMPEQHNHGGGGSPWQFQFPFSSMFQQHGESYQSNVPDVLQNLNFREYKLHVELDSYNRAQIILATTSMCFHCLRIANILSSMLIKLYEHVGGIQSNIAPRAYRFNLERDGALRDELHVHHAPTVMLLLGGRITYYSSLYMSHEDFVQFFQSVFPRNLITQLGRDEHDLPPKYWDWSDNRVRIILAKPTPKPSLRYLFTAYLHREHVKALYVNSEKETAWREKLDNLPLSEEALWVFRETEDTPYDGDRLVQSSMISGETMERLFRAHQHLYVPRLESQKFWQDLCPGPNDNAPPTACAILLVDSVYEGRREGSPLSVYRSFARQKIRKASAYTPDTLVMPQVAGVRLVFTYLDTSKQSAFLESLNFTSDDRNCSLLLTVRHTNDDTFSYKCHPWRRPQHAWYASRDRAKDDATFSKSLGIQLPDYEAPLFMEWLRTQLRDIDGGKKTVSGYEQTGWHTMSLSDMNALVDETIEPLWWRIILRLQQWMHRVWLYFHDIYSEIPLSPMVLILTWICSIIFLTWGWRKDQTSEESTSNRPRQEQSKRDDTHSATSASEVKRPRPAHVPINLMALTPVSYDSLIRSAPQGQLTIVLCVTLNAARSTPLKEKFANCLQPYYHSNLLRGSFVVVERWSTWLTDLFQLALSYNGLGTGENEASGLTTLTDRMRMHPERVCGSVLAFNGYRFWFSLFFPQTFPYRRRGHDNSSTDSGASSDDTDDANNDLVHSLGMNGHASGLRRRERSEADLFERTFQPWLERLWEGTLKRYRVDQWPTNMRSVITTQ